MKLYTIRINQVLIKKNNKHGAKKIKAAIKLGNKVVWFGFVCSVVPFKFSEVITPAAIQREKQNHYIIVLIFYTLNE